MRISLAFDVHGTLVDASNVINSLEKFMGRQAAEVLETWKYKQREYAFRHRLMEEDVDFTVCSEQALEYACLYHKLNIKDGEKAEIMEYSKALPAYPEALAALKALKKLGFRLFAFSNGPQDEVRTLLAQAGLASQFENIYSVQGTKTFKPDPEVYENFLRYNHTGHQFTWFISGNSFDIIGAKNVGLKVVWVQRSPDIVMDPWGVEPDMTVKILTDLVPFFEGKNN
ncbi:haloacid dehalogenase type II [Echinicola marina]|uniref:haloacid dehalogenase type II n=1 Tax=Echinicola marina TaxID=2859768 RepID=UPI001CF6589F|nr:haloacid dehalogenase type II [Echinicola marina]UCS92829.1 haloacid dehalogenase type II [Echinicola marina]